MCFSGFRLARRTPSDLGERKLAQVGVFFAVQGFIRSELQPALCRFSKSLRACHILHIFVVSP